MINGAVFGAVRLPDVFTHSPILAPPYPLGVQWEPPTRPAWVTAVNNGLIDPITAEAKLPLLAGPLLDHVSGLGGLSAAAMVDFLGGDEWLEPFEVLCRALEEEAELTLTGRWLTRRWLVRLVTIRVQVAAAHRDDPGIGPTLAHPPVLVTGFGGGVDGFDPGDGAAVNATRLHDWEWLYPLPRGGDVGGVRFGLLTAERDLIDRSIGMARAIDQPRPTGKPRPVDQPRPTAMPRGESPLAPSLRAHEIGDRFDIASYGAWLDHADLAPAYQWQQRVLLLRESSASRPSSWTLGTAADVARIDALLTAYPDSRGFVRHADPLVALAEEAVAIAELRWAHSSRVDLEAIVDMLATRYRATIDRLVGLADNPGGSRLTHLTEPPSANPVPEYDELRLDPATVATFERYRVRFGIVPTA